MDVIKRILAAYLIVTAIAAAILLIVTPLYHDGSPEYPHWQILNWFMAIGVVVALVVNFIRKRNMVNGGESTLEYVRVSIAYYGAIALTMLFFWEWFWTLNPESETGDAVISHIVYFPIMDALFVVVSLATGCHLWNNQVPIE